MLSQKQSVSRNNNIHIHIHTHSHPFLSLFSISLDSLSLLISCVVFRRESSSFCFFFSYDRVDHSYWWGDCNKLTSLYLYIHSPFLTFSVYFSFLLFVSLISSFRLLFPLLAPFYLSFVSRSIFVLRLTRQLVST